MVVYMLAPYRYFNSRATERYSHARQYYFKNALGGAWGFIGPSPVSSSLGTPLLLSDPG